MSLTCLELLLIQQSLNTRQGVTGDEITCDSQLLRRRPVKLSKVGEALPQAAAVLTKKPLVSRDMTASRRGPPLRPGHGTPLASDSHASFKHLDVRAHVCRILQLTP